MPSPFHHVRTNREGPAANLEEGPYPAAGTLIPDSHHPELWEISDAYKYPICGIL